MKISRPLLVMGAAFGLVALLGIIGFLLPRGVTSTATVQIARPPTQVWQFISDHTNVPKWTPEFKKVEVLPDHRWKAFGHNGEAALFEDTMVAPPKRLVSQLIEKDRSVGGIWELDLTPVMSGGCTVTAHATLILNGPYQRFFAHFLFNGDKEERRTLALLKQAIESPATSSPQSH
ncbi:MAG TPA: SRPBCC family protein [Bryobacteraceae bacterium]|nr:SRPBCC family protein [Bryobacteraceae bacterium]